MRVKMLQKRKEEKPTDVKTFPSSPCLPEVMTHLGLDMLIAGVPIAKERPRFFNVGKSIRCADPQQKIKDAVREEMRYQMGFNPIKQCTNFEVHLEFHMPVPESLSATRKNLLLTKQAHSSRPDIDNLIKFYFDCANTVLWHDDGMISKVSAIKKYSETPKTIIKIIGVPDV